MPHHLARPQSATIGECQHRSRLQARRHDQNTLDLLRAQHWRQLLRFLDVPDLSPRSWRRSVTRNKNRTPVMIRLRLQMLAPLSMRCSWKLRTWSGVAVSGERFSQAANRLQL